MPVNVRGPRSSFDSRPFRTIPSLHRRPFLTISLEVQGDLNSAPDGFSTPTLLTHPTHYFSGFLSHRINVRKAARLLKLPPVLIIHLKRFRSGHHHCRKIDSVCRVFSALDLSRFCPCTHEYSLTGAIMHRGTARQGHYFSFVRRRRADIWLKLNDESVTQVTS
jgi:ubiquitin C-terminal hydrolase